MKKVAVIGAGISGLSIGRLLKNEGFEVIIYEADTRPGGLIKCDSVEGSLFHRTGGHVFNSKRQDVLEFFWSMFDKEYEFVKSDRNASVVMEDGRIVSYPIENHVYQMDEGIIESVTHDLVEMAKQGGKEPENFEDFLKGRFGKTLYDLYFQPYNYKVWRTDLSQVPLSWLEGKLPMPTVQEIIFNNIHHVEEKNFVHSRFYYPRKNGSQFIADRLAKGLNIKYEKKINEIVYSDGKWNVDGSIFDVVIFCGNIKQLPELIKGDVLSPMQIEAINGLKAHGTTSVFCEIDRNKYSWIYQPSRAHDSHRIICTGNFSANNNAEADGKITATVEFTDFISKDEILSNLGKMPFSPRYITHNYEKYTYPIQDSDTRGMVSDIKSKLNAYGLFLLGRFAEWEYYNMDVAVGAAIDLVEKLVGLSKDKCIG